MVSFSTIDASEKSTPSVSLPLAIAKSMAPLRLSESLLLVLVLFVEFYLEFVF